MRCKVGRRGQRRQIFVGQSAVEPGVRQRRPQRFVEADRRFVPIQHLPLQALGVHRPRVGGHGEEQTADTLAAPRFGDDQILEVPSSLSTCCIARGEGPCPRFGLTPRPRNTQNGPGPCPTASLHSQGDLLLGALVPGHSTMSPCTAPPPKGRRNEQQLVVNLQKGPWRPGEVTPYLGGTPACTWKTCPWPPWTL